MQPQVHLIFPPLPNPFPDLVRPWEDEDESEDGSEENLANRN